MSMWIKALLWLAVLAGAVGIGLSVTMIVSAFQFSEWGRVILYFVTAIVSLEMLLLALGKLNNKENT